jgi:hypothetical protein
MEGHRVMNAQRKRRWVFFVSLLLAGTAAKADVLGPGQVMTAGQRLYSANQLYYAMLDTDGEFAVYRRDGSRTWASGTRGSGAIRAAMQRDGGFVLHDVAGKTVWSTGTRGRHRVFGVNSWGAAVVINARRWKPRDKRAEPFVEEMLHRRAKLDWVSPTFDSAATHQRRR